ncbi:MAG: hypothetical protein HY984_00290 [Candidatus Magasanikbacteria bacterium]|nr:hypothetical protein [Candidatus Magasanikbacteria bacterium]
MNRKLLAASSLVGLLLTVGAGCAEQNQTTDTGAKPADADSGAAITATVSPSTTIEIKSDKESQPTETTELKLTAEALGNGEVKLQWTLPDAMVTTDGFRLIRAKQENPVNDGKNYWYKTNSRRHEYVWTKVTTGTQHIRVCTLKGEDCIAYSNDAAVEVK